MIVSVLLALQALVPPGPPGTPPPPPPPDIVARMTRDELVAAHLCPNPRINCPAPPCTWRGQPVILSKRQFPAGVLDALPFKMADVGEPYERGDVLTNDGLPSSRLICGYVVGDTFVIQYEHGGRGWGIGRIGLQKTATGYVAKPDH